jgi:hypothetical protein
MLGTDAAAAPLTTPFGHLCGLLHFHLAFRPDAPAAAGAAGARCDPQSTRSLPASPSASASTTSSSGFASSPTSHPASSVQSVPASPGAGPAPAPATRPSCAAGASPGAPRPVGGLRAAAAASAAALAAADGAAVARARPPPGRPASVGGASTSSERSAASGVLGRSQSVGARTPAPLVVAMAKENQALRQETVRRLAWPGPWRTAQAAQPPVLVCARDAGLLVVLPLPPPRHSP